MSDFEPKGGCNAHGPYEICGHTTETCPDNTQIDSGSEEAMIVDIHTGQEVSKAEKLVRQAASFDDLVSRIDEHGISIQGSQEVYTPEMLRDVATRIRKREWPLEKATSREGFRAKLAELLESDNDPQFLHKTLAEAESRLFSESYVIGGSPDHPLNRTRADRERWKSRLQAAIAELDRVQS